MLKYFEAYNNVRLAALLFSQELEQAETSDITKHSVITKRHTRKDVKFLEITLSRLTGYEKF